MKIDISPLSAGILGSAGMFVFYFAVLAISNGIEHLFSQLMEFWPFISIIGIGFGIQMGLMRFNSIRISEMSSHGLMPEAAVSGGMSGGAMIACCAHHLADFAPLAGFSTAFLFLAEYQVVFLWAGVISTLLGIAVMATKMNESGILKIKELNRILRTHATTGAVLLGPLILGLIILSSA